MTPTPSGLPRPSAWLLTGCLLFAAAFVWSLSHDRARRAPGNAAPGEAGPAARRNVAPRMARLDFALTELDGSRVTLGAAKGKVIVLNFWATWCPPCRRETPDLVRLQEAYRDKVVLFGILVQDPMGEATHAFKREFGINYAILDGNDRHDVEQAFGPMVGLPTTVIIDREGRIVARHAGARTKEQLERDIRPLLE